MDKAHSHDPGRAAYVSDLSARLALTTNDIVALRWPARERVPRDVEINNPTLERLEDQIGWYDHKSAESQQRFKLLKAAQMISAAAIPVLVATDVAAYVAAALGSLVLILEGFLQLNQYQQNWITYRSTAEALKHEKYLYLGRADVYAGAMDPVALLAERIEGLISQEHAKWVSARREAVRSKEDRGAQ